MLELLRKNFQLAMVVFLCSCAIVAIAPFSVVRYVAGDYLIAALDASIALVMTMLLAYAIKTRRVEMVSILISTFYTMAAILIIHLRLESTLYWAYPIAVANFFVVSLRAAMTLNGLIILSLIPLYPQFSTHFEFFGVVVTLLLVTAMASIFSWKTDSQRKELELQATLDPLTGIKNRRSLDDIASQAMSRFQRKREPASVILMDLDYFKQINDDFGHETGDRVLRDVATVLTDFTRKGTDTVFRYGGEEFLILVSQAKLEDVVKIAEKLREFITLRIESPGGPVCASFGCAQLKAEESMDKWINRADQALYEAKNAGRNCVRPALNQLHSEAVTSSKKTDAIGS